MNAMRTGMVALSYVTTPLDPTFAFVILVIDYHQIGITAQVLMTVTGSTHIDEWLFG